MMKKLLSIALIALILASCVHESPFRSEYYFQAMGRSGEIVITVDTRESGILSGLLPEEIHGRADRISAAIDGEGNVYGGAEGNFGYAGVNALLDWVPEFRKIDGEPFFVLLGDVLVPDNQMLIRMKEVSDEHNGASVIASTSTLGSAKA